MIIVCPSLWLVRILRDWGEGQTIFLTHKTHKFMEYKLLSLPRFCIIEELFRSADSLESFTIHSLEVAATLSNTDSSVYSTTIIDGEQLKAEIETAKYCVESLRKMAWEMTLKDNLPYIRELWLEYSDFVEKYLTPKNEVSEEEKKDFINNCIHRKAIIDDEAGIEEHIKGMNYPDFLQTPYWKIIAEYRKSQDKKCAFCGSTERLEVHHPTYQHHGMEHKHTDELIVICHSCHEKLSKKAK